MSALMPSTPPVVLSREEKIPSRATSTFTQLPF